MDGKRSHKLEVEKPIAKPDFPLPGIFRNGMYAEMPTRRRPQKAHFYRRRRTESGTPVYDFFISDESEH